MVNVIGLFMGKMIAGGLGAPDGAATRAGLVASMLPFTTGVAVAAVIGRNAAAPPPTTSETTGTGTTGTATGTTGVTTTGTGTTVTTVGLGSSPP